MRYAKQAAAHRGRLHVVCGRPQILRLFHLTGLDDRVSLARTLADALQSLDDNPGR
jgi:anti-anti-sigma regulatory factor